MKRILYFCFIVAALTLGATACVKDEMSENSVIVVSKTKQNDFDLSDLDLDEMEEELKDL